MHSQSLFAKDAAFSEDCRGSYRSGNSRDTYFLLYFTRARCSKQQIQRLLLNKLQVNALLKQTEEFDVNSI